MFEIIAALLFESGSWRYGPGPRQRAVHSKRPTLPGGGGAGCHLHRRLSRVCALPSHTQLPVQEFLITDLSISSEITAFNTARCEEKFYPRKEKFSKVLNVGHGAHRHRKCRCTWQPSATARRPSVLTSVRPLQPAVRRHVSWCLFALLSSHVQEGTGSVSTSRPSSGPRRLHSATWRSANRRSRVIAALFVLERNKGFPETETTRRWALRFWRRSGCWYSCSGL
jgi:hypothetical protein